MIRWPFRHRREHRRRLTLSLEQKQALLAAINAMPPRQRQVAYCKAHGLMLPQIAQVVGITIDEAADALADVAERLLQLRLIVIPRSGESESSS